MGGENENRGKRSVDDIAARMEEKGFNRAVFVFEKHGNPDSLNFFDLKDGKGWLYPEVIIGEVKILKAEGTRVLAVGSFKALDKSGEKIIELLDSGEAPFGTGEVVASEKEIAFYNGKEKVVSIVVKGFKVAEVESEG